MLTLKRQFLTDSSGQPIAVVLPVAEYALVAETLDQRLNAQRDTERLQLLAQAAHDSLFMDDLHATMEAFAAVDAEDTAES